MRITRLTPADAAAFKALRLAGLREHPESFGASYEKELAQPLSEAAQRLAAEPDRAVFGARRDGALVGVIGIYRETGLKQAHKGGIWGMYVDPASRGQGVAAALLRHALAFAAEHDGWMLVRLSANAANTAAIRLYESQGFVQYGLERGALLVDGVLHDEVLMQCQVRPLAVNPIAI